MTLRSYIHSRSKRAEAIALLDSGATENFMNLQYAKYLHLPIKNLPEERKLYNVDGTENRAGKLKHYTDLQVRTGQQTKNLRFFLSDLGEHKVILGFPWFAAMQPKIDWAKGWLDHVQLPIVIRAPDAAKAKFIPRTQNVPRPLRTIARTATIPQERYFIGRVTFQAAEESDENLDKIPTEYQRHRKVFSEQASHRLPKHTIWDHAIELSPDAPNTLPARLIPLAQDELKAAHDFVEEHLARKTIEKCDGPYAASFFFVKKGDGKLRPVQDYRPVNKYTIRNRNVSPLIPQVIDRLAGCTLFTTFDVRWGYNNIRIKEGDEWKAAFLTHEGLFQPKVMFFGLTNSPATFQTMMNTIFRKEIGQGWLSVYMDDMAIHTHPLLNETPEQHVQRHRGYVHRVLEILEENDLYLKPEKCQFEQGEIKFLGVMVGNGQLKMDPKKLQGIADWKPPRNVREVRKFLGFTGYYRYFVPNYSKSHDHYWTSPKRQPPGLMGIAKCAPSRSSRRACVPPQFSNNLTSNDAFSSKWTPQLTAWAPYSRRRENTLRKHSPNAPDLHSTPLHTFRPRSPPQKGTTTSMNENYWQ
jgi:hypothetical protein